MPRLTRCLSAALLVVLLSTAAPAVADTQTHHDPRGDVTRLTGRLAQPEGNLDDIVRLKNSYQGRWLKLSMTAVELPRRGWTAFWDVLVQPSGRDYFVVFDLDRRTPYLSVTSYPRGQRAPGRIQLPPTECESATAEVHGSSVVAAIPRSCLGNPRLVRVSGVIQDEQRSRWDSSRRRGYDPTTGDFGVGPPLAHD